ncbi:MAG: penicillin-binding protein 1A [Cyclobacteriaceae bacterium]
MWYKKVIRSFWYLLIGGIFSVLLLVGSISINLFGLFGDIPSFTILESPKKDLATSIYSEDGVLMGKYFDSENRVDVPFHEISPYVIKALVATEDERFESHSGIDMRALLRVVKGLITGNSSLGGGSTISQQLAKNLFRMRDEPRYKGKLYSIGAIRMFAIKVKEMITAVRLEKSYTKREIITMYLNTVSFGSRSFGIQAAAKTFFNKKPIDLKIEEAAVLVGTLKANTTYNPYLHKDNSFKRRNVVMYQMKKYNYLDASAYDSLKYVPLKLDYSPENYNEGIAPYFRSSIKSKIQTWCEKNGYDLYRGGLKVHTTINSKVQFAAEKAVKEHMSQLQRTFQSDWNGKQPFSNEYLITQLKKTPYYYDLKKKYKRKTDSINYYLNKRRPSSVFTWNGIKDTVISFAGEFRHQKQFLRTGCIAFDPHSREIKAWVGGINHELFPLDHVSQTKRQPGSTFKPILYATAIINGYTPCSTLPDAPVTISAGDGSFWEPKGTNYSGKSLTLKEALARSMNNISAKLMEKVGPTNVVAFAKSIGIESELNPVLSLALGTSNVSVLEITNAYNTFVAGGVYKKPIYISKIEDKTGKVIAEFSNESSAEEVMSKENAYQVVSLLRGSVLHPKGTARRLDSEYNLLDNGNQIGGKTGTTQNSTDGWFMSITNNLVVGCWVGGEDNNIHFKSGFYGQGARMAMPIIGKLFKQLYQDKKSSIQPSIFPLPEGVGHTFIETITCETSTTVLPDSSLLYTPDSQEIEDPLN